MLGLVKTTFVN